MIRAYQTVMIRTSAGRIHSGGCMITHRALYNCSRPQTFFSSHTSFLRSRSTHPRSHHTKKPRQWVKSDSRNFSSATPIHTHSTCHVCPDTHQSSLKSRVYCFKGGVRGGQHRHQTEANGFAFICYKSYVHRFKGGVRGDQPRRQISDYKHQRRSARRPASSSHLRSIDVSQLGISRIQTEYCTPAAPAAELRKNIPVVPHKTVVHVRLARIAKRHFLS